MAYKIRSKFEKERTYQFDNKRLAKADRIAPDSYVHKGEFTIPKAIQIQKRDIYWWSSVIKDKKKKKEFLMAVKELQKKNEKAKTPYEIPRGVEIEHLFYKINLGYTDEEYAKHLRSYD